jgi:hypothetical protein
MLYEPIGKLSVHREKNWRRPSNGRAKNKTKQNKIKKNRVHHTYIYNEEREWISSHNKLLSWYRSYTVNDERLFHWRTEHNYNANEARSSFVLELLFILLVWFIHHGYHSFCHEDKG